jgi:hypothetical protein
MWFTHLQILPVRCFGGASAGGQRIARKTGQAYQEAVQGQHLDDTQRCQSHGPVRLLVRLLEFNHLGPGGEARKDVS